MSDEPNDAPEPVVLSAEQVIGDCIVAALNAAKADPNTSARDYAAIAQAAATAKLAQVMHDTLAFQLQGAQRVRVPNLRIQ
jgi:hypothetical protein